ncbi:helix-turn-helix domain-containing protein [Pseudomonas sp. MBLB4136]|uniref:helix-turn-helix domain-containing protein n=1 Tax=Pseudomonas sp. MBLB4136 TaxID=3451558 RepID=UPI003F74E160
MDDYIEIPLHFTAEHCAQARELLGWSQEHLAEESGVSLEAIQQYEAKKRELSEVTRQALAFRLEAEGLVFINGHQPLWGMDVRGATDDPRDRKDFHLVE